MTGSHNLGPKASGTNDENFVFIKGNKRLAAAYASNIMGIYNQYRWRWRLQNVQGTNNWNGLQDNDRWQIDPNHPKPSDERRRRELDFWLGR
jgi:phosphatidylserine/phosphatidylglycerophosphate/cardiolipin synthase-like enzyme